MIIRNKSKYLIIYTLYYSKRIRVGSFKAAQRIKRTGTDDGAIPAYVEG